MASEIFLQVNKISYFQYRSRALNQSKSGGVWKPDWANILKNDSSSPGGKFLLNGQWNLLQVNKIFLFPV